MLTRFSSYIVALFCFTFISVSVAFASQPTQEALVIVPDSSLTHEIKCPAENQSHSKTNAAHHCCAAFCALKEPYLTELKLTDTRQSSLALIRPDKSEKAVARIQTLFRPPIA
ncbi:hypothetical protein [Vibrio tetraodonis]|uniref:hypothetical protein n=1 Tax=Vibrio tetraodonis TaxID=2231647 RepID=UPI0019659DC0|nr:hypothetical protein [Vibrio tetraodonis]